MNKHFPENIDQIEAFYRDKFSSYETAPSDQLWDKLSSKITPPKAGINGLYTKLISGISILSFVYIAYLYLQSRNIEPLKETIIKSPQSKNEVIVPQPTKDVSQPKNEKNASKLINEQQPKERVKELESIITKNEKQVDLVEDIKKTNQEVYYDSVKPQETINNSEQKSINAEKKLPKSLFDKLKALKKDSVKNIFIKPND